MTYLIKNKMKKLTLLLTFIISFQTFPQNGKIISESDFNLKSFDTIYKRVSDGEGNLKAKYHYLADVEMKVFFYESDGLKVKGYMSYPKDTSKKYPVIIYNRGGNREFGNLNKYKMTFIIAKAASWGYVVLASQYRGNDGGEGMEEFGGSDVNDVINLVDVAKNIPFADETNMGLYGWSRGGMMTYLTLMKSDKFKAAAVGGAVTNLKEMDDKRGGEMGVYVYSELMPGYGKNKDSVMAIRSAIYHADKLPKTTPILLVHGTSDWRVIPEQSIKMALELQKYKVPYRLVMFEGGDHGLSEFRKEVNDQVKAWFDKFLKNNQSLPDLEPHGR